MLCSSVGPERTSNWIKPEGQGHPEQRVGGIYLFRDAEAAERYRQKHAARLTSFGITGIVARAFATNAELSAITRGPC